jgi:hypothetical protein
MTPAKAGTQEIAMTQAITATPKAAGMPETVLTPKSHEFSQKFAKNSSECRKFINKYKENE